MGKAEELDLTKNEKKVNKVAKETFGITKGVTFPTLSNDMGLAGVSIISFKDSYANKILETNVLNYLRKCARQYHDPPRRSL